MNVKCKFDDTERHYELIQALLIYSCGSRKAATINPVTDGEIMPGCALDDEKLTEVVNQLSGKRKIKKLALLPRNVLALGEKSMIWFSPSRVGKIWFRTSDNDLNKLSGKMVRYPGIVFKVASGRMSAWAVYGNDYPAPASMMFRMPFYNCSARDGWVCLPGGKKPQVEPENIAKWESYFYDSNFSHSGMGGSPFVRGGHNKFWIRYTAQCERKMPKRFPCEYLIPANTTLEELIEK